MPRFRTDGGPAAPLLPIRASSTKPRARARSGRRDGWSWARRLARQPAVRSVYLDRVDAGQHCTAPCLGVLVDDGRISSSVRPRGGSPNRLAAPSEAESGASPVSMLARGSASGVVQLGGDAPALVVNGLRELPERGTEVVVVQPSGIPRRPADLPVDRRVLEDDQADAAADVHNRHVAHGYHAASEGGPRVPSALTLSTRHTSRLALCSSFGPSRAQRRCTLVVRWSWTSPQWARKTSRRASGGDIARRKVVGMRSHRTRVPPSRQSRSDADRARASEEGYYRDVHAERAPRGVLPRGDRRAGIDPGAVEDVIAAGAGDVVVAAGVEHMGHVPLGVGDNWADVVGTHRPLGSRGEIVPVAVNGDTHVVDRGIRPATTREALARLRPVFKEDGRITAATSSHVSDGTAAVLLTSPETAGRARVLHPRRDRRPGRRGRRSGDDADRPDSCQPANPRAQWPAHRGRPPLR